MHPFFVASRIMQHMVAIAGLKKRSNFNSNGNHVLFFCDLQRLMRNGFRIWDLNFITLIFS